MKKFLGSFFGIAAGLLLLTASAVAADQPKYGGKLVVGQDIDAVGLDPYKTTAFASLNYFEHIYNSLLQFDAQGKVKPELALSWENPGPTTYVFRLRKDVKFHDGKEFTADDVKATFDRALDPKTGSARALTFKPVDRVEVVDKHAVRFVLKEPFAPFLNYLASPAHSSILSKGVIEKSDPNQVVIGTGPFQMAEFRPNDTMLLKKNPHYWEKGLPYLDQLEIRLIKDPASRVAALRAKSVDHIWIMEPQLVQVLMKEKGINSAMAASTARKRVFINSTKPPLNNVKVRQALSLATDRKELIRVTVMGKGELCGALPAAVGDYAFPADKLPFYNYDPEGAKKLLSEAGYPNGFKVQYKVSAAHITDQYAAQMIQRQWKKIGVDVEIVQVEWGTIIRTINEKNYEIGCMTDFWRPDPDEYIVYNWDIVTRTGFKSPDLDKMTVEALTTVDHSKRVALYHEIEKKIAEYAPILYIYAHPQRFEFWGESVKGYVPLPQCSRVNLKKAWIEK
ncbi:MAG TPA: ABC transporter substrate-binding protein [Thermodesulfobacteriota bacterium]|nr:ABC transporter substrate-binding protein [Thermodesulfobacteriota bacterium]